ncbi:hypothetical protein EVAR_527_1 [Eumeta japonica]|uniref:Uncharacterized protein n=1 Tax=Eumeta variegata TaxID=151549 RepID=A0A4C1SBN2_EUMVA|nr:hypothetical protein EVAR_527_1 [Eumeta japonica]
MATPRAREPAGHKPRASGGTEACNSVNREFRFHNEMTQFSVLWRVTAGITDGLPESSMNASHSCPFEARCGAEPRRGRAAAPAASAPYSAESIACDRRRRRRRPRRRDADIPRLLVVFPSPRPFVNRLGAAAVVKIEPADEPHVNCRLPRTI